MVGTVEKWGPVLISIMREENVEVVKGSGERETAYRLIIRFRDVRTYNLTQATRETRASPSDSVEKVILGKKTVRATSTATFGQEHKLFKVKNYRS